MTLSMGMGYRLGKFGIFLACSFGLLVGFFLLVKIFEMLTVLFGTTGSNVLWVGGLGGELADDEDVSDNVFGCL